MKHGNAKRIETHAIPREGEGHFGKEMPCATYATN